MSRLSQIDANLLVALDVLLEERHVTRAARRLGITQPAMSQTLGRLRDALDDPLLVRSGARMVTTPRADALTGPLKNALNALEEVLTDPSPFDPARARRTFKIATLDFYSTTLLPPLLERIATAGVGLSLDCIALDLDRIWGQLRAGEVELAIVNPRDVPTDITTELLRQEHMVVIAREDHPLFDAPEITPEAYCRWPQLVFRLTGRGEHLIDARLGVMGLSRRVVGRTPFFLSAPWVVLAGHTIVNLPSSTARSMATRWPIRIFEPPLAPMDFEVHMAWPAYLDNDAPHQWFRAQVRQSMASLRGLEL